MHKDRSSRNLWEKYTSIRCLEKMVHQVCHSNQQLEAWENSGDPSRLFFMFFFLQKFWRLTSCFKLTLISGQYIQLWHSLALMYGLLLLSPDRNQPNGLFQGAKSLIKTVLLSVPKASSPVPIVPWKGPLPAAQSTLSMPAASYGSSSYTGMVEMVASTILRTFSPIQ